MRTILFICTGNTCRSPLAEAAARHWIAHGGLGADADILVASAGVSATSGAPVSPETIRALQRYEIEHDGSSKPLSREMIRRADLVLCMTHGHLEAARALVADAPDDLAKIALLDPDDDIDDPVGMGQSAYDALAERLIALIPPRLKELLDENRAGI